MTNTAETRAEVRTSHSLPISRNERFNPRNILRNIREYIPLPLVFGVLGGVTLSFLGPHVLSFHGETAIYGFVGFASGFILGTIVESFAGPEAWTPKS